MKNFLEKLKSRKFIVWFVWLVLSFIATKTPDLPKETIFEFFGYVSLIYIGGNVAQKYLEKK